MQESHVGKGIARLVRELISGYLILAWAVIHQDELMQNWELSKAHEPLNRIASLM